MKTMFVILCLTCAAFGKPPIRISGLVVTDYAYDLHERDLGVQIQLGKEDAEKFSKLSRESVGRKLKFTIGESTTQSPTVREPISDGRIWLTFRDVDSFKAAEKALSQP